MAPPCAAAETAVATTEVRITASATISRLDTLVVRTNRLRIVLPVGVVRHVGDLLDRPRYERQDFPRVCRPRCCAGERDAKLERVELSDVSTRSDLAH